MRLFSMLQSVASLDLPAAPYKNIRLALNFW